MKTVIEASLNGVGFIVGKLLMKHNSNLLGVIL